MSEITKRKYIDLFAGCGGLSLGLFNSGLWHGLFAIEKSPDAFKTLEYNLIERNGHFSWPEWLKCSNHDINEIIENHKEELLNLRGKVDLVAGGPPCQGFSMAGRRLEKDQRNNLVVSYLKFIDLVRPKALLFENVKGFKIGFKRDDNTRGEPYSEWVINYLKELGYSDAKAETLNFSEFGIPQHRQRCIIVGTRNNIASNFFEQIKQGAASFLSLKGLERTQGLEAAISDIQRKHGELQSPDNPSFRAGLYATESASAYQKLMRGEFSGPPDSHRFAKHSVGVELKFRTIIKERLKSKEVQQRFNTKKSSTRLLDPKVPTPTLTTLPDDYVHYCEPRILTVREYARIQSFSDWYEFKGKYTTGGERRMQEVPRYSQIGNAIPPLFAEQAGLVLTRMISDD